MNLKKFSQANKVRCEKDFGHTLESWSVAEWTNAMCGEAGEAANLSKKIIRHRDKIVGNKGDDKNLELLRRRCIEECADVIVYADLCIQALDGDTSAVLAYVFNRKSKEIGSSVLVEENSE